MDSITIKNTTIATTWRLSTEGEIFVTSQTNDVGGTRIHTNIFTKDEGIALMEWLSEATK